MTPQSKNPEKIAAEGKRRNRQKIRPAREEACAEDSRSGSSMVFVRCGVHVQKSLAKLRKLRLPIDIRIVIQQTGFLQILPGMAIFEIIVPICQTHSYYCFCAIRFRLVFTPSISSKLASICKPFSPADHSRIFMKPAFFRQYCKKSRSKPQR